MKAETHLEVYRRFQGSLRTRSVRFWPLIVAGLRVGFQKKIPMLLLFGVPAIATVILSFLVYAKFAAESDLLPETLGGGAGLVEIVAKKAATRLEVRNMILEFVVVMRLFALLSAAWYGSGLLVEDRRAGAHQLYFSRPLTRLDYFLGKFLTAAIFGAITMLLPGLVMCLVAGFSSPEWSFFKEDWDVVLRTIAVGLVWITVTSSIVLCASALATRRSFALAGTFAFFMLTSALGLVLGELEGPVFRAIGMFRSIRVVSYAIFEQREDWVNLSPTEASISLSIVTVLSLSLVAWRIRRLEVVA